MNRPAPDQKHPWRITVALEAVPDTGLSREIEASPAEREAMRQFAGLRDLPAARVQFELTHAGRGRARAVGRVTATVGQICVVTLEPIENRIDEPIDALFVPQDEIEAITRAMDKEAERTGEMADPPEPIVDGVLDVGKLAADVLFLAIDPYPRKPDARFEPPPVAVDEDEHPFAALKALKDKPPEKPGEG
jgi:uncharacterized metal-binding protein YceD (DUF177 family)